MLYKLTGVELTMAASKPELKLTHIYLSLQTLQEQRLNGYINVFRVQLSSIGLIGIRFDQTRSVKSRWRPLNVKYTYINFKTIFQCNSNGYTYVFGVKLSNGTKINDVQLTKPEVGNPIWQPSVLIFAAVENSLVLFTSYDICNDWLGCSVYSLDSVESVMLFVTGQVTTVFKIQ